MRIILTKKAPIAAGAVLAAFGLFSGVVFVDSTMTVLTAYDHQQQADTSGVIAQGNLSAKTMRFKNEIAAEMKKQHFDLSWLPVLLAHVEVETHGNAEKYPDILQASEYARGMNHTNELSTKESIHYGVACMKNAVAKLSKVAGHKLSARNVGDVNMTSDYYNFSSLDAWMKQNDVHKWSVENHNYFYAWAARQGGGSGDTEYYKKILKYYDPDTGILGGVAESSSKIAAKAVKIALKQTGKSYVWGATGPNSFDCSGLVIYSFKKAGVAISGRPNTKTMYAGNGNFKRIKKKDLKAGDLVLFKLSGSVDHVGIYLGNDQMVNAETDQNPPDKQIEVVSIASGSYWSKHIAGYSRVVQ